MTGRPSNTLIGTQTKYCIACGARYRTKKYERKHCKKCEQAGGLARVSVEPFKARWVAVDPSVTTHKTGEWNQSSVHCVETNKGCHTCDNALAYGIEWMSGCYMPHSVQKLLDSGKSIPARYLSSEYERKANP